MSTPRASKRLRVTKPRHSTTLIERTNALPLHVLKTQFLPSELELSFALDDDRAFDVELFTSQSLPSSFFNACFKMLESNMKDGYVGFLSFFSSTKDIICNSKFLGMAYDRYLTSSLGWHPQKKKKEMRHPAMRYLVLFDRNEIGASVKNGEDTAEETGDHDKRTDQYRDDSRNDQNLEVSINKQEQDEDEDKDAGWESDDASTASDELPDGFVGFLSFMITEEEDWDVIYTYELNLSSSVQNLGLGKRLMHIMEHFGDKVGVEKSMLTVFDTNKGARRFYEKIGYQLDETSPGPKLLRNGVLKESTYHILSKPYPRYLQRDQI